MSAQVFDVLDVQNMSTHSDTVTGDSFLVPLASVFVDSRNNEYYCFHQVPHHAANIFQALLVGNGDRRG